MPPSPKGSDRPFQPQVSGLVWSEQGIWNAPVGKGVTPC